MIRTKPKTKVNLSYSQLGMFASCPRQYYYRYINKEVEDKPTIWPGNVVGQIFHAVQENVIKLKNDNNSDKVIVANFKSKFKDLYDEYVAENKKFYKKSREVSMAGDTFYSTHDKLLVSFIKFVLSYFFINESNIIIPEEEFKIEWNWDNEISVIGILDIRAINNELGTQRIYDLKVTKDSTTYYFIDWNSALQKQMYEYYVYKKEGRIPDSFSYIVLNREDKFLFFKEQMKAHDELKIIEAKTYFKTLHDKLVELKKFNLNPDVELADPEENKCKWCTYKKICDKAHVNQYAKALSKRRKK